jgi:DNA gyrase/topoisomerase IV subunit B
MGVVELYEKTTELANVLIKIVNLQSNVIEEFLNSYNRFSAGTDINELVKQVTDIIDEINEMKNLAEANNGNANQS